MKTKQFFLCLMIVFALQSNAQIRVACVGNSITYGYGLPNSSYESYPAQLGAMLGTGFVVNNYGDSGKTMVNKGDVSYWNSGSFTAAKDFNPQIVIINLGTNDSDPARWNDNSFKDSYKNDYEAMIDEFRKNGKNPIIFTCLTPPKFANDGQATIIKNEVLPIINQVSIDKGTYVIDFFNNLLGQDSSFPDTVHPNFKGSTLLAQIAYDAINSHNLIVPHISVNSVSALATEVTVNVSDNIILDPAPASPTLITEGTWQWIGSNNFTASTRQVNLNNITVTSGGFYVAIYTNPAGLKSTQCFSITVNGCTADQIATHNNNGSGWTQNTDISIASGANLSFGPQPLIGTWSWTGPNGFKYCNREFNINNIKTKHAGDYVVVYTNLNGCKSTATFKVAVTGEDICNAKITPYMNIDDVWQNVSSASVKSGDLVKFGPGGSSNGSWDWKGPNGFTTTNREFILSNLTTTMSGIYKAKFTDAEGCEAVMDFSLIIDGTLGLEQVNSVNAKMSVYPNPSNGVLNIDINGKEYKSIRIFSSTGTLIYSKKIDGENNLKIDTSSLLKTGIYMITLQSNAGNVTKKLIIK